MIADNTLRSPHHPFGTYVPQGLSPSAAGHCLLLAILLIMAVACGRPASYEKFVRADEAAGGVYEFCPEMSDTTASYDLSFYTAPLSEPLHLEIIWNSQHRETVWFPAGKHRALYRSGIRAGSDTLEMQLRVRPLNAPGDFRGLGIIMHQNDGTR